MEMTTTSLEQKMPNWWNTEWYKEWERLSKKTSQTRVGKWVCFYNEKNELVYEYVDM
jgi:hypothetical protein